MNEGDGEGKIRIIMSSSLLREQNIFIEKTRFINNSKDELMAGQYVILQSF